MSEIIFWILENLSWMSLSIIKFLITPSAMVLSGDCLWYEIIIVTTIGASLGVLLFYFFGKLIFSLWNLHKTKLIGKFSSKTKREKVKPNSKRHRRIIAFKNRYGINGLLFLSFLISVPISSVLAAKYFGNDRLVVLKLCFAFLCWSIVLTLGTLLVVHFIDFDL
tara:strand:- start:2881 stop:3375 length:495 start_codon:yes stop_codon:yes gene_type:complete